MPAFYCIQPDKKLIVVKYRGDMTIGEQIEILNTLLSDPQYEPGIDSISDLTEANYDWKLSEIDHLRSYMQTNRARIGQCKWALISRGLNEVSGSSVEVRLFQTLDDAYEWLGLEPPSG